MVAEKKYFAVPLCTLTMILLTEDAYMGCILLLAEIILLNVTEDIFVQIYMKCNEFI